MKPTSIRLRLIVAAVISIVATLAVAGISLVSVFERQILRRVEQELEVRWTELAAAFALDAAGKPSLVRPLVDPRYHQPYSGAYWQVAEDGNVVLSSRSQWDGKLDVDAPRAAGGDRAAFEIAGPADSTLYVIDRPVVLAGSRTFELAVALDHAEVDALRAAFERDVLRILGPIALVLALAAWFQLRQSLRPLRELDRQLNAVHDGRQPRLGSEFPPEVAPVVSDLNRLLDRQEKLIRKARDRAGALAHGLKTPLTILGAEARRLEKQGLTEAAAKISGQIDAIRRQTDRELARARSAGASAAAGSFTDVADTVDRLVRLMHRLPRGEALTFENRVPAGLTVRLDPDDFGEVIGNLLDNARKWARSRVVVAAEIVGDKARIVVEDDGNGFNPAAGDASRGSLVPADDDSSGLGLGIVRDILSEYGIDLAIGTRDGWCRVSLAAPLGAKAETANTRSGRAHDAKRMPSPLPENA